MRSGFFGSFRGGDARNWLLKIVRNTCYTQLQKNRPQELATSTKKSTVKTTVR